MIDESRIPRIKRVANGQLRQNVCHLDRELTMSKAKSVPGKANHHPGTKSCAIGGLKVKK